jgi:hypothetical protein
LKEFEGVEKGEGSSSHFFCVVGIGTSSVLHSHAILGFMHLADQNGSEQAVSAGGTGC